MNFNIVTLGCKVNQYESQAMREDLICNGYELSPDKDKADITIINSCTVTSVSDAKNRKNHKQNTPSKSKWYHYIDRMYASGLSG